MWVELRVEMRTFDSSHTAVNHVDCDGTKVFIAMFFAKFFNFFLLFWDDFG